MNAARLRPNYPSCIYSPINAQIARQTRSILTIVIIGKHSILSSSSWQYNHYALAVKVLLRHLKRRYTTKKINNYADSKNGKDFRFEKFPYLSHLLTLASEGHAWTNYPDNLLCRDYSRMHLERLNGIVVVSFIQLLAARRNHSL